MSNGSLGRAFGAAGAPGGRLRLGSRAAFAIGERSTWILLVASHLGVHACAGPPAGAGAPASGAAAGEDGAADGGSGASSGDGGLDGFAAQPGPDGGGMEAGCLADGADLPVGDAGCSPGSTVACYTGPPASQGLGTCRGGAQVCGVQGTPEGPCTGEVGPKADDCSTAIDESCGEAPCPAATLGARRYGGPSVDTAIRVHAPDSRNVVLAWFHHSMDPSEPKDFVTLGDRVESDHWTTGMPTSLLDLAMEAACGPIYVGSLGGLAALDVAGKLLWERHFPVSSAPSPPYAAAVATRPSGMTAVGWFSGTVDFGGGPAPSAGWEDVFVAGYTSAGELTRLHVYGDALDNQRADCVAVWPDGRTALGGSFFGSLDFGSTRIVSEGGEGGWGDGYVAVLEEDGGAAWARRFGDPALQTVADLAAAPDGELVVLGWFQGTVDFGAGPVSVSSDTDLFVARYSSAGELLWLVTSTGGVAIGEALALDADGNILVTGCHAFSTDFGGGSHAGHFGYCDLFVLKLSPEGEHLWSRSFGGPTWDSGTHVAVDPLGRVLVSGYFEGTIDFGSGPLVSAGGTDGYLLHLAP